MPGHSAGTELRIVIRPATASDIPEILRQRGMYEDMHYTDADALAQMVKLSAEYLAKAMSDGSFQAWLASEKSRIVAGGAIILTPWLAHPYDLECRRATILNVYTYPEYRRRGIARKLMTTMIEWSRQQGLARITLHASDHGRHLYESLGFEPSHEMTLKLP